MKNYPWPLLFLFLMAFAACKKDHDNHPAALPAAIEGSWLLIRAEGGLSGGQHEITNKQELIFRNGKQELLINGVRKSISGYQLIKIDTAADGSWELKTDRLSRSFVTLKNDMLCIMADISDAMYLYYIRE